MYVTFLMDSVFSFNVTNKNPCQHEKYKYFPIFFFFFINGKIQSFLYINELYSYTQIRKYMYVYCTACVGELEKYLYKLHNFPSNIYR